MEPGASRRVAGDLMPFNTEGFHNAPNDLATNFFLGGDVRANEQIGLTAVHVLFVREHNYWAERIAREDREWRQRRQSGGGHRRGHGGSGGGRALTEDELRGHRSQALSGDEIYELARAIVSAEIQQITYEEWLPLLLGEGALPSSSTYRPELDAGIRNSFATAAFRFGHSMLSPTLLRLDRNWRPIALGHVDLRDAFFAPATLIETGIDPLLRGQLSQRSQDLDAYVIDDIRNFLFGAPGAGGFDLASLNIQRGRDHGLPSYAQARRDLGLGAPSSLSEISSDPEVTARLESAARSPEELDLWVGGLAEDDLPGALVGPTFHAILSLQFEALRDGDRLWHTRQLSARLLDLVERQSLARIIERNSGLQHGEARDPFIER